jgi:hypothetical protein
MYSISQNFVTAVIDEIALEGLDGITLEGEVICVNNLSSYQLYIYIYGFLLYCFNIL